MNLNELKSMAQERFQKQPPSVPMLLLMWAENDSDSELKSFIEPAGISIDSFSAVMQRLIEEGGPDDREIVTQCILNSLNALPTGRDLLETLCSHPGHPIAVALADAGLNIQSLHRKLKDAGKTPHTSMLASHGIKVDQDISPLLKFGRDLTALAKEGCFIGYYNRPEELNKMVSILKRMERGNPILTGEAGVGKTALVELLAREIVANKIRGIDSQTRIFEVSIGKLIAGTRYRGDFEKRVDDILQSVIRAAPAFLFLDEAHLLFGTGRAEGAPMDMANFLKPFLARGDLRVIAATTSDEYNRYIAPDNALARRFAEVNISEPDLHLTTCMVRERARQIAAHHRIEISDDIINRTIALTDEYLPQSLQPYKSIDLLDTAAAEASIQGIDSLDEEILISTLAGLTKRDVEELKGERKQVLRKLTALLKERIIGQDAAIEKVVAVVVRQSQKLGNTQRNRGTFLFVGPTGVGKSELARQLAFAMYSDRHALLTLDMAEYAEPGSINKLIGAPPGFMGAEKEGELIRWLQNHPTSGVLLFDEIEKAGRDIKNLLLSVLDNGRITSAHGKRMDCRYCVVIMTSNAISKESLSRTPIGFGGAQTAVKPAELLTSSFPAEFLERLDDIILFNALGKDDILKIIRLRLDEAAERLRKRRIHLYADMERLTRYLANKLDPSSGARGIERIVEQTVIDPIALAYVKLDDIKAVEVFIGDEFYENGSVEFRPQKQ